jgi:hypothetical protein
MDSLEAGLVDGAHNAGKAVPTITPAVAGRAISSAATKPAPRLETHNISSFSIPQKE